MTCCTADSSVVPKLREKLAPLSRITEYPTSLVLPDLSLSSGCLFRQVSCWVLGGCDSNHSRRHRQSASADITTFLNFVKAVASPRAGLKESLKDVAECS